MTVSARALLMALGASAFALPAFAQTTTAPEAEAEVVVVTGTRVAARSALDTAAPVDVVSSAQLATQGSTELNQQLAVALPSFNFPRPAITDGTDSVRPATLRGLSPDHTLVLVNSKRRHTASLVNINGSIGRGASATDLNTIPSGIIESVEVLRDGASAQYGSDAIAGVINMRLKQRSEGGNITVSYGQRITTVETDSPPPLVAGAAAGVPATGLWFGTQLVTNPSWQTKFSREERDGDTFAVNGWLGLPLTENGSLTLAAEVQTRESTNRQAYDTRRLYPLVNGGLDPREATIDRFSNQQYGEGELLQATLFANASIDLTDTTRVYGWASMQGRDSTNAAFFRWPNDGRNVLAIYPNGFLPKINSLINDSSVALGIESKLAGWDVDVSLNRGENKMDYTIRDTLNNTFGASSPTSFDAGGFSNDQTVLTVSAVKGYDFNLASDVNVAIGLEARRDHYEIRAGETASGQGSGSQGFPGFQIVNATAKSRQSIGGYIDVEANITDAFLLSGAVRAEEYSDFGSNVSGKVSARYDFSDAFALRGSVSTGFRAPSLQQQFFTSSAINVINGSPVEVGTFASTSRAGLALGGQPLKAEKSENLSIGGVLRFGGLAITVDAYQIKLTDRIVLSENLNQASVVTLLRSQGITNVTAARFFLNGVDSTSNGVDLVASYRLNLDNFGRFDFSLSGNVNETTVDKVPNIPALTAIGLTPTQLFNRQNTLTLTEGQPKEKATFSTNWSLDRFAATFKANYYGSVTEPSSLDAARDIVLAPEVLFDLEGRVKVGDKFKFILGVENLTDVYPSKTPGAVIVSPSSFYLVNQQTALGFSRYSPFGFSGRYVYGKVSFDF